MKIRHIYLTLLLAFCLPLVGFAQSEPVINDGVGPNSSFSLFDLRVGSGEHSDESGGSGGGNKVFEEETTSGPISDALPFLCALVGLYAVFVRVRKIE